MNAHVSVTLFETTVFAHKVQVVTTDDNGTLHLSLADNTGQDAATNPHIAGPGALLVNVGAINCLFGKRTIRLVGEFNGAQVGKFLASPHGGS